MAMVHGRDFVVPDDVKAIAVEALAHRLILQTEVVLEGGTEREVIEEVVQQIPAPTDLGIRDEQTETQPA